MLESIVKMLDAKPFHPFRIVLTSGSAYDVTNPHLVAMGQSQIVFCFPRSDRHAILRLNQIAAIETIQADAA